MQLNPNKLGCTYISLSGHPVFRNGEVAIVLNGRQEIIKSRIRPDEDFTLIPTGFLYACTS